MLSISFSEISFFRVEHIQTRMKEVNITICAIAGLILSHIPVKDSL